MSRRDASPHVNGKCVAQLLVVERFRHALARGVCGQRGLAHEACVRRAMVMRVEKRHEADIDIVERADLAEVIEHVCTESAPKALHFAAGLGIVGFGVQKAHAESRARETESLAAISRAVIEVQGVGFSMAAHRADEDVEHVFFALGGVGFERDDEA